MLAAGNYCGGSGSLQPRCQETAHSGAQKFFAVAILNNMVVYAPSLDGRFPISIWRPIVRMSHCFFVLKYYRRRSNREAPLTACKSVSLGQQDQAARHVVQAGRL